MALTMSGVEKSYPGGFRAVDHLDLEVNDGEFFTLLGPSGCGKTTTLRIIAGLETPSSGKVFIGGRDYTHTHPRDRDVAMVFQSYALYPHMTVRQNLVLNLEVRKIAEREIEQRVREVSRMLGLGELLDRKPGQLSGGQRQRVALGRALIRRPNIFLMDEPLSNLDLKLRERTRTELKKLHERLRVTTIYVTHDQAEALVLSDRIGIMNAGELLQVGSPQEIYDRPADIFVAKFVGSPSINLLPVTSEARDRQLTLRLKAGGQEIGTALPTPPDVVARIQQAGALVLGVRPESIEPLHAAAPDTTQAVIDVVEPMGSVNHLVIRLDGVEDPTMDGEPLIAVVRSNEKFEQGAPTWLRVRPDRLVLFHAGNGRALATLSSIGEWQCV
jgi:sn-glycerol 3-phosphate transport system ATP-binding protein